MDNGCKPGNNNNGDGYGAGDDDLDQFVEKKMESLIMSLEVFCFKQNLPVKQFFDCIHSMYLLAERLGFPLEDIPVYIEEQEARIKDLSEQIKYWESEKQAALEKCQTTEKLLEEFELSRPMFDSNQQLKQELEQVTKERDKYKFELENERIWKRKEEEFEWLIAVPELEKANKELKHKAGQYNTCQYVSPRYLKEMVMAVYHNPSKYIDIISKLMERYHPEHPSKEGEIK